MLPTPNHPVPPRDPEARINELLKANTGYLEQAREARRRIVRLERALAHEMIERMTILHRHGATAEGAWTPADQFSRRLAKEIGLSETEANSLETVYLHAVETVKSTIKTI